MPVIVFGVSISWLIYLGTNIKAFSWNVLFLRKCDHYSQRHIHHYIILDRGEFLNLDRPPCAGGRALPPSQKEKYHCATDRNFTRS